VLQKKESISPRLQEDDGRTSCGKDKRYVLSMAYARQQGTVKTTL